jgi:hypothetical protein
VPARATVRLPVGCNNRCIFCAQEGLVASGPSVREQLADARRTADEVTFVGGEPLLDPALVNHVAEARGMGFVRAGIQSNGRGLGDDSIVASLAAAGLTDVHLSVHGADAAVHDYHTGIPGSLARALDTVGAARSSGVTVVVATVLTRSNFRSLAPLPKLFASKGVAAWLVAVPAVAGRARGGFDRVVPRLGLALPFALSALDSARALGVEPFVSGAPRCMLGPLARRALPEPARAYAPACEGCPARASCPGLDGVYLARFGGDEVQVARGRMPAGPHEPPGETLLSRMFVGAGELALDGALSPAVATARRVSLPIAGKAKPARGEAAQASPRQTGEALKAILPGLFENRGKAKE